MNIDEYSELLSKFKDILRDNSLKFTSQREAILRTLYSAPGHHSSEELHMIVKKKNKNCKVGVSTVYRTLNLLEEASLVTSISFGSNGKKFELASVDHHDHIICIKCDKIVEFEDDIIENRQEEIAKSVGFELTDHLMQLYGICNECKDK